MYSIKSTAKVSQLQATINPTNPGKYFVVETKLDSSMLTYSFLRIYYEGMKQLGKTAMSIEVEF